MILFRQGAAGNELNRNFLDSGHPKANKATIIIPAVSSNAMHCRAFRDENGKHHPMNYMKAHQTFRTYLVGACVSLCAALAFAHHAKGGDYDTHYTAKLSKNDHYNSNGERLTSVADILRQDRANYHNGDGDALDEDDQGYFSTRKARNKFDNHKIILKGISAPEIANRTPLVIVEVHGDTIYVFSE